MAIASVLHESRPLPPVTDYSALFDAVVAHRLQPLASRAIQQSDWPEADTRRFRTQAGFLTLHARDKETHDAAALRALESAGVETLVLKGPALARTVYPEPWLRISSDLDVLVHQEDWMAAHQALLGAGYSCRQALTAPPPKVAQGKAYYHTQYLSSDHRHLVEIHYDLWWYGLRPALGPQYWRRAVPLEIGGAHTKTVSAEDMLLHLCIHLHHHGYDRLVWFTDLALLLRANPAFDWTYLVAAARTEGLGIFVYYSLHYLARLLGVSVPTWVLATLRPGPMQAWLHDRLCPPHTVLEVEVHDRVLFDFHEVPEATELVLNFVLTGRRREKLAYLFRLLAPSREWLAYYYQTTDPATLRRRRLTHAPTLVLKAARELADAARSGIARQSLV